MSFVRSFRCRPGEFQVYFYAGQNLRAPVIAQPSAIASLANDPSSKEGFTLAFGNLVAPFGGIASPVYNASASGSGLDCSFVAFSWYE
jgi:hypothetical protein